MEQQEGKKRGFLSGLKEGLRKTRDGFIKKLDRLLMGKVRLDAQTLEEFEELLITADLGVATTARLIRDVEARISRSEAQNPDLLRRCVQEAITEILLPREVPLEPGSHRPFVVMVIGVNGVGKTTTIAKLGWLWKTQGRKVMLVAGDTFRAAAIEQLQSWAERIGVEVTRQQHGADPSAVVFDALQSAKARSTDVVILDTAGRLHTKVNLMEELKKIQRVTARVVPGAPHEVLLVLDATTGQNAISQARLFHQAVGVTGIVMTKLDGTAKGGILVAVASEFEIPIRFVGIGEKMEDLQRFDARGFVAALFGEGEEL
ncbi:MAG: signal recognition particle-docking protein FtsY [bacterium]